MKQKEEKQKEEWLVIQRSKRTKVPRKTVALDPEYDAILDGKSNVSDWMREAIKEKSEREAGIITLSPAEDDIYGVIETFFCDQDLAHQLDFSRKLLCYTKGDRFPEKVSDQLSEAILNFVYDWISERFDSESFEAPSAALKLVKKAREDKEFWNELYRRIRIQYLRDLRDWKRSKDKR